MHAYTILDVFTSIPLEGNPVAVFDDGSDLSDAQMQRVARELNLSETVFLLPADGAADARPLPDGEADARARIFTPSTELPFAGHPVLGTAFLLAERTHESLVRLQTGAGVIPITLRRERETITFGEMEQPIPTAEPFRQGDAVLKALGIEESALGSKQSSHLLNAYRNGPLHLYVELDSEAGVEALSPDTQALGRIGAFGVSCFAASDGHAKTRMFAPGLGVPEDPATGSAAGPLAVHLASRGRLACGQTLEIEQGAEIGRPSKLYARVEGSPERIERVVVGGSAVVVARGAFRLD